MQALVEIGPSNASQGQHRRKDATEQMKNLTLARTRTQVPGFSSVDALYIYIVSTHIYICIYICVCACVNACWCICVYVYSWQYYRVREMNQRSKYIDICSLKTVDFRSYQLMCHSVVTYHRRFGELDSIPGCVKFLFIPMYSFVHKTLTNS